MGVRRPRALYVGLVHAPVLDRVGDEIAASVNEHDWFDASRLVLTYDVRRLIVVQPTPAQQAVVRRFIAFGTSPDRDPRTEGVMDRGVLVDTVEAAVAAVAEEAGARPVVAVTSARAAPGTVSFAEARRRLATGEPWLVLFGKAYGLTETVFAAADVRLEPIRAEAAFNHLSVRSALAIALDRLT